jgi:predicted Rossmann fold flavoprotein
MEEGSVRRVVVVGAGAAGLMASIFAARGGARVCLLEGTSEGGRKILISGGGRCNVLPSILDADRYVTDSSRNSLRKILLSWPLEEQRAFFEDELLIPLALEAATGKLFPAFGGARDIRDALVRAAIRAGVEIRYNVRVSRLTRSSTGELESASPGWLVGAGETHLPADRVVLATGGLSVPKTGSDGWGLSVLGRLGHGMIPPYPALTPLTADPPVHGDLAGVSLEVALSAPAPGGPYSTEGGFLFTHRGWSGPSVLNISHLATRAESSGQQAILARWGAIQPEEWREEFGTGGARHVSTIVRQKLPVRLADRLIEESGVDGSQPLARLRREERERLLTVLTRYELPWTGNEGYRKAEVTGGGIKLGEVRPDTLESRITPGLFLCGELLDAFGPIGGYNFAWAWATGRAAGRGAAR